MSNEAEVTLNLSSLHRKVPNVHDIFPTLLIVVESWKASERASGRFLKLATISTAQPRFERGMNAARRARPPPHIFLAAARLCGSSDATLHSTATSAIPVANEPLFPTRPPRVRVAVALALHTLFLIPAIIYALRRAPRDFVVVRRRRRRRRHRCHS